MSPMACHLHSAREKPRIKKMQDRMFHAANVLVHVHPIIEIFFIRRRHRSWRCKARKIPRTVHKSVHRICFTQRVLTTGRTGTFAPCRMPVKRVAGDIKAYIIGKGYGQVFFLFSHDSAGLAMDHGNGASPIPLAAEPPIAKAKIGDPLAPIIFFGKSDSRIDCLLPCRDI